MLPSEDEWYKAAYHKNDGVANHYWDYPTGTDSVPSNDLLTPDPGNNANFRDADPYDWGYTTPDRLTDVGAFENSTSPYGSFDQGGSVFEWNEALIGDHYRGRRGGFWGNGSDYLRASCQDFNEPTGEGPMDGFRVVSIVASVPEPSTALLAMLGIMLACWRRARSARSCRSGRGIIWA